MESIQITRKKCELPEYNADGEPLAAFVYVAMRLVISVGRQKKFILFN